MMQDLSRMSDEELLRALGRAPAQTGLSSMSDADLMRQLAPPEPPAQRRPPDEPQATPDNIPVRPFGMAGSESNPINLSIASPDAVASLRAGEWVRDRNGNVYALPSDPTRGPGRPGDEQQSSGVYQRPSDTTPGYLLAREQEEQKARDMPGYGRVGFMDQATAPFNDEMAAAMGFIGQGAANIGRSLMGGQNEVSAFERARAMRDLSNEAQESYERERPVSSLLGQIVGGAAVAPARAGAGLMAISRPSATGFAAPTGRQAVMQAGGVGAAYGAGAGEGVEGRAGGALLGGALAAGTAGALDAGIGMASRMATRRGSGPERRVANALERVLRDDQITDPAAALANLPSGGRPLDIDTPYMQGLTELAAQTPGPARQAIRDLAGNRQGGAADRFRDRIAENLGGQGDYFRTLDSAIESRRTAANQGIRAIEGQQVRLSQDAVTALRSDLAQQEVRRIAQLSLGSPDEATRLNGAALNRLAGDLLDNPAAARLDLRSAQELSRRLLSASDDAWRGGDGFRGQVLGDIGRAVRESATESVPAYRQWLRQYGEDSDNIAALEMGRRVMQNANDPRPDGMSAEVLRRQFNDMSEAGRDMFRKGVGEALVAQARATGDMNAMRRLLRSEEVADRIRIAFPDEQGFNRFMQSVEAEVSMAARDQRIVGGSPTGYRQQLDRRFNGGSMENAGGDLSGVTLTGLAASGARRGARAVGRALDRNRSILQNQTSNEILGRALTDPDYLIRLLEQSGRSNRGRGLFGRTPPGMAAALQNRVM